jgi:hypothetical protein
MRLICFLSGRSLIRETEQLHRLALATDFGSSTKAKQLSGIVSFLTAADFRSTENGEESGDIK